MTLAALAHRALAVLALAALPWAALAQTLTVSAAASLTDAFREIGARFEASRPGTTLRFNFGSSGVLLQQILQGAPVDVLASADRETMERGLARGAIDADTWRDFAGNALVVIVPAAGGPVLTGLADLATPPVRRIAVGKIATVPAGRYTKQALDAANLWGALEPKLVFGDNVRQVLDYVARGEVEAGFVYLTDAARMADRVRIALTASGHAPITYPAAVVADSRLKPLARDFVTFLSAPQAQAILAKHGFTRP